MQFSRDEDEQEALRNVKQNELANTPRGSVIIVY